MILPPAIVGLIPDENPLVHIAGILPPVQENPLPTVIAENPLPAIIAENPLPTIIAENPLPTVIAENPLPTVIAENPLPDVGLPLARQPFDRDWPVHNMGRIDVPCSECGALH